MSKLECFIMASVYAALGVPLLIISLNIPEAEDLTKLKGGDIEKKILDYPTNAVIVSKVLPWQQMLCGFEGIEKGIGKGLGKCMEVCAKTPSEIKGFQKLCAEKCIAQYASQKCKSILNMKPGLSDPYPFGTHDLSQEFNALRMISFVVSILLLVMSFVKLIEMFVVKSSKKSRSKKKSRK